MGAFVEKLTTSFDQDDFLTKAVEPDFAARISDIWVMLEEFARLVTEVQIPTR
jgi:hypothetical protein